MDASDFTLTSSGVSGGDITNIAAHCRRVGLRLGGVLLLRPDLISSQMSSSIPLDHCLTQSR